MEKKRIPILKPNDQWAVIENKSCKNVYNTALAKIGKKTIKMDTNINIQRNTVLVGTLNIAALGKIRKESLPTFFCTLVK